MCSPYAHLRTAAGCLSFHPMAQCVVHAPKAWLAARVSLRLARLPRTASSAQRSRRLRSTRAAAPGLLAHANVTEIIKHFSMGPKLRHTAVVVCVRSKAWLAARAGVSGRRITPANLHLRRASPFRARF